MRPYHPGGHGRKLCQRCLVSGARDRLMELELSGAAGLMGFSLFWDLRENMGPRKVLKRRRWEGSEQLKWRHPFRVKCYPAGEGESGGTGAGSCGLGQLPPTPSTPSTKTPGVIATLMQKQEEEGVSRTLPGAPFPPGASLPLHLQSSPSSCRSLLGTLLVTDTSDLPTAVSQGSGSGRAPCSFVSKVGTWAVSTLFTGPCPLSSISRGPGAVPSEI